MNQKELTDRLDNASKLYYQGKETEYSDTEFDLNLKILSDLEKESGIVYPNSPTLRVGSDLQKGFGKIKHPFPMLTIDNVYEGKDLEKWLIKMQSEYSVNRFNISVKYDGISCELHYKDGYLSSASTRGDKMTGDDITENVRTIKSVPLSIGNIPGDVYVRGEILFPKRELSILNEKRLKEGLPPFANTRNACSGSVKQLNPKITRERKLVFRAWDCFRPEGFTTMNEKFSMLREYGFIFEKNTEPFSVSGEISSIIEKVDSFHKRISEMTESGVIDYDNDGIVIKIDNMEIQNKIGTEDTRAIKWGIARKWNEEYSVETTIENVVFQTGRTGNVTPVANLKPVECNGVIVSNATLNNESFIINLDIRIGDVVSITRSGGVIPMIERNISSLRNDKERGKKVYFPEICPECGKPLVKTGEIWKCVNHNCPAKLKGQILQWCSKDCLDIKAIGEKTIEDFHNHLGITTIFDLYSILEKTDNELLSLLGEGYKEKSISNIKKGLIESISCSSDKILSGLGIEGIGKVNSRVLIKKLGSLENIFKAKKDELIAIEGIGEVLAQNIFDFMNKTIADTPNFVLWSRFLKKYGFTCIDEKVAENANESDLPLSGLVIVFTGKSKRFQGDGIEEFMEAKGAKTSHSISKKTNILVTGENPGQGKLDKAKGFGTEIITEDEFYEKYKL